METKSTLEVNAHKIKKVLAEANNKIAYCTTRKFVLRIEYHDSHLFATEFLLFLEKEKIITIAALTSKSRKQEINFVRQSIAKIFVEYEHLPLTKVGELLNRTHSSIIFYMNNDSFYFKSYYNKIFSMYETFLDMYYSTGKC